jgi:tetratricopeptide (TPR) repeat protein
MGLRALIALCLALLWLPANGKAQAQAEPAAPPIESAEASEARRLYAEGKVQYAQGNFVEAIALFERSYALSEAPGLLFNLAQAHRLLGDAHCAEALALYKSYLAALPAAENRREVEERIAQLHSCASRPQADEATPAPAAAPAVAPTVEEPPRARALPPLRSERAVRLPPVLLASVGVASLVAGGVLFARAKQRHDEAERECPCYPGTLDRWKRLSAVSYALLGVGGASLAAGLSWWAFAGPSPRGTQAMLGASVRF